MLLFWFKFVAYSSGHRSTSRLPKFASPLMMTIPPRTTKLPSLHYVILTKSLHQIARPLQVLRTRLRLLIQIAHHPRTHSFQVRQLYLLHPRRHHVNARKTLTTASLLKAQTHLGPHLWNHHSFVSTAICKILRATSILFLRLSGSF